MRPRTKKQRRIVELADTLPDITREQREYAFSHCFKVMAYNCKGEAWCTECGHTFTPDVSTLSIALEIGDKIKCPHCGEMLTLKNSRKKKDIPQRVYYDIITTCGEFQVFRHFVMFLNGRLTWRVYDAAIVATRHRYKIKDATMWTDMIEMLMSEGKDFKNPHYICPKNLKKAHDHWLKRKQAREREAERRRRQRIAEAEARKNEKLKEVYKVLQQVFGGWTFGDADIHLHIIDNMDELKEEGEVMHHCVWTNYREMDGWVIVSARDNEDQRIATIELSTKDWRVVQCRAKHNAKPERYEEIMDVMNSSINEVRRRYER